ncbi:MAG: transaldolase [Gemmatimonadetes bacterium]|nr:transaldolase [Gemmatimonadota bacterium]
MNSLQRLWDFGQSFWLDNLTREMLRDGELARRVTEQGLRGVTSNPAIFHKAITQGDEYNEDISRFSAEGLGVTEIYDRLTISDVQGACDVLHDVWSDSDGLDGYVSLEVSPHLAHDTDGTLSEARRLYEAVDRDNVLIKIPGTPAGVPAIRDALFEGVNVNVTLLFSIAAYDAVADAYIDALEARLDAGRSVDDMASVASFFLSRIDSLADEELEKLAAESLLGQAAVANAKLAYASFERRLEGDRWRALAEAGAQPQRMLWASTSTKNAAYSDVKYVEPLIGDLTINTMPESTVVAFLDHGTVADTVREGVDEARETMRRIAEAGIDFDAVTDQLLAEGVAKFITPFDRLLEGLEERAAALVVG